MEYLLINVITSYYAGGKDSASSGPPAVKSKWELVDYGDDSDERCVPLLGGKEGCWTRR